MQMPLQITLHALSHSDALKARINQRANKLEWLLPRATSCHVTVEETRKHHAHGHEFAVHVQIRAPGHEEVVVTRQHDHDVMVAVRDAFDAVERGLGEWLHDSRLHSTQ